nr:unnamed protein product [Callosobruchus chinensis]
MSEHISDIVGDIGFSMVYFKMTPQFQRFNATFLKLVSHTKFGKPKTFDDVTKACKLRALFFVFFVTVRTKQPPSHVHRVKVHLRRNMM